VTALTAGHGLPPVTAGIVVWLDGVGQAGTYGTVERMNGRTRLHRCREGIPINNGTRIGVWGPYKPRTGRTGQCVNHAPAILAAPAVYCIRGRIIGLHQARGRQTVQNVNEKQTVPIGRQSKHASAIELLKASNTV